MRGRPFTMAWRADDSEEALKAAYLAEGDSTSLPNPIFAAAQTELSDAQSAYRALTGQNWIPVGPA